MEGGWRGEGDGRSEKAAPGWVGNGDKSYEQYNIIMRLALIEA